MARVRVEGTTDSNTVEVSGGDARHLFKVLRLRAGDAVVVFDGKGSEWDATIAAIGPTRASLTLGVKRTRVTESPCRIVLGQGVGKGDKLDFVVRAATELGVAEIVPVVTGRAVATADGREKVERWRRIAEEACKQCGRSLVPTIHAPLDLPSFLAYAKDASVKVVPWEGGGATLSAVLADAGRASSAAALIGPEGGLAAAEVAAAEGAGFKPVTLGPRILRTETAGIVAVAALQLLAGDLG